MNLNIHPWIVARDVKDPDSALQSLKERFKDVTTFLRSGNDILVVLYGHQKFIAPKVSQFKDYVASLQD